MPLPLLLLLDDDGTAVVDVPVLLQLGRPHAKVLFEQVFYFAQQQH